MMRDPAFTQTMQIGIVVRDLDATMRKYLDEYGIGPSKIYEFNRHDLREYGQPVKRSWRLAVAMVGQLRLQCPPEPPTSIGTELPFNY
jgi:methylmalonyl-CoA/ethylmalonyl-CoA epimerase